MTPEAEVMLERASRRTRWASLALAAAAEDLRKAGEQGAVTNGTAAQLRLCSRRAGELAGQIVADRELAGSHRRLRDAL